MHVAASKLPDTVDALRAIVRAERAELAVMKAHVAEQTERNDRLERLVEEFRRMLFGKRSEKLDPDQLELAFEDIETAIASVEAEIEKPDQDVGGKKPRRNGNRGALPKHLPREDVVIEPESTICSCGACMHRIGEDRSERLDVIPAQFKVIVTRRPKYACRACQAGVVQAPAPDRLIQGGIPTEGLVAHVLVGKYADHLPLYRQAQIFSRSGVDLDRSTLADWVGRAAFELRPVFDRLVGHLKTSSKLFMDETRAPVLDPGRGKTKTGYLWALARDDRPWGGTDPPGIAYFYAPGRGGAHAQDFLDGFTGILQVDGYAGYNRLTRPGRAGGPLALAYCWAHARRKLYEIVNSGPSPIAEDGLRQIAALYRIEAHISGRSADQRREYRQQHAVPLIEAFESWLGVQRSRVSTRSRIGEALRYIANHIAGLKHFLDDGRIEIDSNIVERSIRPIALSRKNALFAGHDEGARNWGVIASLIETAKLNDVEPQAYLTATLENIAAGHPHSKIDDLMPWRKIKG